MFNYFCKNKTTLSQDEAYANMKADKKIVLLDVRSPQEYNELKIPNSLNIPLGNIDLIAQEVPDQSTTIYVYCHSGVRAKLAVSKLKKAGYPNVFNIGGIVSWNYETE